MHAPKARAPRPPPSVTPVALAVAGGAHSLPSAAHSPAFAQHASGNTRVFSYRRSGSQNTSSATKAGWAPVTPTALPGRSARLTRNAHKTHVNTRTHTHKHTALNATAAVAGLIGGVILVSSRASALHCIFMFNCPSGWLTAAADCLPLMRTRVATVVANYLLG